MLHAASRTLDSATSVSPTRPSPQSQSSAVSCCGRLAFRRPQGRPAGGASCDGAAVLTPALLLPPEGGHRARTDGGFRNGRVPRVILGRARAAASSRGEAEVDSSPTAVLARCSFHRSSANEATLPLRTRRGTALCGPSSWCSPPERKSCSSDQRRLRCRRLDCATPTTEALSARSRATTAARRPRRKRKRAADRRQPGRA
jgi:hypothetical protein